MELEEGTRKPFETHTCTLHVSICNCCTIFFVLKILLPHLHFPSDVQIFLLEILAYIMLHN